MDTKVKSALNYLHEKLTDRECKSLLNQLAFEYGIRLHARDAHTYARPAERNIPVVVVGDNNFNSDDHTDENAVNNASYKQKMQLVGRIINKDTWATKGRDFNAFAGEMKFLLNTLTLSELEKLDGQALLDMCRIVQQSRDSTVTNRTAYVIGAYSNLVNGVDYKKRWVLKYKFDHGEISKDEFLARL